MGLREYIIRRIILMVPTVLGVVLLIFIVLQFIPPESRATLYVRDPSKLRNIQEIIDAFGLNRPVYEQFAIWLREILQGNFGYAVYTGHEPVLDGLLARLPATMEIVIYSAPLIVLFGISLGTTAAVHRDKPLDHVSRVMSILGTSLPSFFFGILLIALFVAQLKWTTPGRASNMGLVLIRAKQGLYTRYTGLLTIDSLLNGDWMLFIDAAKHLVLPALVLVFIQSAQIVRVSRSSMLESLSKTYIVAARAKGLSRKEVIYGHARRNALIPVVTISGLLVGTMMTGLTITETVFQFGGIGNWAANAAIALDVPVVAAYAMFSALVFVVANLIVDILYAYIDPRIRLG